MRAALIPVAILGVATAAAALQVAGGRILAGEAQLQQEFLLEVPDIVEMEPQTAPAVPHQVRPVAPDIVAVPPVETAELLRVEERQPLSDIGRAPDPRDLPPEETILHRPVATAAGAFEAQGHKVVLAGIVVTPADEMCGEGGRQWPCGIHARTAFRTWLRGRALTCTVRPVPVDEAVVSDCRLGSQSAAEWLVSQGWVRAAQVGPYAGLDATAQKERRGLFGLAPDVSQPLQAPEQMPGESPPSGG